ncbi:heterokaryon incompatibility protein-domain-containing protein [Microdochium bolleyi]|uniref:Heterokaryon incompatibility protein-domain-containing protein n=1 Tax=Microdochium bolleyi TaxID=196109 RepID=A0A136J8Q0_9PEZI|nr:heterokaryon incompatibility protein-domain-containing protein [Microdochium bolleyi]
MALLAHEDTDHGHNAVDERVNVRMPDLDKWYREYCAIDANKLTRRDDVITAVDGDEVDAGNEKIRLENLMATMPSFDRFCDRCQHLIDHWPDFVSGAQDWAMGMAFDTFQLEASARKGCHFCSLILSVLIIKEQIFETLRRIEYRLRTAGDNGVITITIAQYHKSHDGIQVLLVNFPGKITSAHDAPDPRCCDLVCHSRPPTEPLWMKDLDQLDLAKHWLADCVSGHGLCVSHTVFDTASRPTRVLSICDDAVKLVSTEFLIPTPSYATLSYCWGTEPFLKLTPETLESFMQGIDWDQLPRTFRDAITLARKLGIDHMWIDALCIIQDQADNTDWLHESNLMGSIYGGSRLNIAASTATSVFESLDSRRRFSDGSNGFCTRFTVVDESGDPSYTVVRQVFSDRIHTECASQGHLATRGWTLQERLLAPRTLMIGSNGMFWDCRTKEASESVPDGLAPLPGKMLRADTEAWDWTEIIKQFSRTELTFASDRLPALSGIAKRQQRVTGDEYLAGMWRAELVRQLPWRVRPTRQKPAWRAPSWSWASVDGPFNRGHSYRFATSIREGRPHSWLREHVRVKEVSTTLAGPDTCGAVTAGHISLEFFQLARGKLLCPSYDKPLYQRVLFESSNKRFLVSIDYDIEAATATNSIVYLLTTTVGSDGNYVAPQEYIAGPEIPENSEEVSVTAIAAGIVLQRHDKGKGSFRRIGSFEYRRVPFAGKLYLQGTPLHSFYIFQIDDYDDFANVMWREGRATAEAVCAEVLGPDETSPHTRYLMTIY